MRSKVLFLMLWIIFLSLPVISQLLYPSLEILFWFLKVDIAPERSRFFDQLHMFSLFTSQFPVTGHYWGLFSFHILHFPFNTSYIGHFLLRLKVIEFPWVHSSKFLFSLVWNLFYRDGAELGISLVLGMDMIWLREPSKIQKNWAYDKHALRHC